MTILPLNPSANATPEALRAFLAKCRGAAASDGRPRLVSISVEVAPLDPLLLTQKGSIFLTRPSLGNYIATAQELQQRAAAVFGMIGGGKLKLRIEHVYPLAQARQAHRDLEGRKTTGKLLLLP